MSEIPVKIDNVDERWSDWVMPGGKDEYDQLPAALKPHLRSLARRPEALTPPDKLIEYYDLIDRLTHDSSSGVKDSDTAPFLGRIAEKMQQLEEKELKNKGAQKRQAVPKSSGKDDIKDLTQVLTKFVKTQSPLDPEALARAMGVPGTIETENLYRQAERAIVAFEIGIGHTPNFLIGKTEEEKDSWESRAKLVSAANIKYTAPSFDKLFPNDFVGKITTKDMELLLGGKNEGAWRSLCVYATLIKDDIDPKNLIGDIRLQSKDPEKIVLEQLKKNCPNSIFEIDKKSKYEALRDTMAFWLRHKIGLSKDQAMDAEQIAWNFVYLSNMIEDYDNRLYRPNSKRIANLNAYPLKSAATWMIMHPQERLEAKTRTDIETNEGGEAWGAVGEWALNYKKTYGQDLPIKFPEQTLKNAFATIKKEKGKDDIPTLEQVLINNGRILINNPRSQIEKLNFYKLGETPFSLYYLDGISSAITLFGAIAGGGKMENPYSKLSDAYRNLRPMRGGESFTRAEKENIAKAISGINPNSRGFDTFNGKLGWRFELNSIKRYFPNYFKD